MLTRATVFLFISSFCVSVGSNSCPSVCTCASSGREVDCMGKHLKAIPEILVPNITTLDVSFNNISEVVLIHPENLEMQLKFFFIDNNHIENVTKSNFERLPELIHVRLANNLITVIDPLAFEANTKLYKLVLSGNKLTLTNGTEFLIVPSLGQIELENCSISNLPVDVFMNMSKLVIIKLSNNRIESLDDELFSHLKQLTHLYLEGNKIKEIDPNVFRTNSKLQMLYLRNNPLNDFSGSPHFLRSLSLLALDMSYCNITEIPRNFFANLHSLTSLKLNNNLLDSFNMTVVPRNLEFLDISGNSMTTINVTKEKIMRFSSIKHLALTDNKFTCDCDLLDPWLWCAKLRGENGGATSCGEFCPDLKPETCDGGTTELSVRGHVLKNMKEPDAGQTSDNEENSEVENLEGSGVGKGEGAKNASGQFRSEEENYPSVSSSATERRVWNIVTYSCIGVFGVFCLIGVAVLLTDTFLIRGKPRRKTRTPSPSESFRNVRLELMYPRDNLQETTPLSLHRGFFSNSMPTDAHTHS